MEAHLKENYISKFEELLEKDLGFEVIKRLNNIPLGVNYRIDGLVEIRTGSFELPIVLEVRGSIQHLSQIKRFLEFLEKGFEETLGEIIAILDKKGGERRKLREILNSS